VLGALVSTGRRRIGVAGALLVVAAAAHATVVGGGGSPTTDCLLVFDAAVNTPAAKPKYVTCTDGDPTCDMDKTVNGVCEFPVGACANSTFDSRCTVSGVQSITVAHALDDGDSKFDTQFQALQQRIAGTIAPPTSDPDSCISPVTFRLPVDGPYLNNVCRRVRKTIAVTTVSTPIGGRLFVDKDKMRLTCNPAPPPGGCDPRVFFTGTYDRIQNQIFDRSCALSGCHDSQTHQNGLILEPGASYTNLFGVMPFNQAASDAGWKRVMPGDPTTSYVFRKITGDLPDSTFGVRMPFHRAALDPHLIDVIMLWIQSGAPQDPMSCADPSPPPNCWVPGTDS
jgi:hypothetical protein